MNSAETRNKLGDKRAILAIVLISYLLIVLDISIVITGLAEMQQELGFSATSLSWVQNAYTLAFGGFLLLGARAGDLFGRRRMFILGLGIFTVASVGIGLAQSAAWLIIVHGLQGIGSAILAPSTLALLSTNFAEGPERTRAVGYYGAIAGVGASLGLVLGGVFAGLLSWRVGFFMNVPLGLALMAAAWRYIDESEQRPGVLDMTGALTSTLGMAALVYGLVRSAESGWSDIFTLSAIGVGSLLLAVFVFHEARASNPIMPLRLFADRERAGAYAVRMLFLGAMVSFWFFTTQLLQSVLGFPPEKAGFAFLATTLPNFAAAMAVPRLTARFSSGWILAAGLSIALTGMALLSRFNTDSSYVLGVILPMVLIGIGQGGTLAPLTVSGIVRVVPNDAGAASGLVNGAHQLGGSLGLAILVVVFAAAGLSDPGDKDGLAHQLASAFTGSSIMLALALVLAVVLISRPRKLGRLS